MGWSSNPHGKIRYIMEKEKKSITTKKDFERELLKKEIFLTILTMIVFFLNMYYTSGIFTFFSKIDTLYFVIITLILFIFLQLLIAPQLNSSLAKEITEALEQNAAGKINLQQRTELVKKIMEFPQIFSIKVSAGFFVGCLIPVFILIAKFNVSKAVTTYIIICTGIVLFIAAATSYTNVSAFCSSIAIDLVKQGVDSDIVHKEKYFGYSLNRQIFKTCISPTTLTTLHLLFFLSMAFKDCWSQKDVIRTSIIILVGNTLICLSTLFQMNMKFYNVSQKLNMILLKLTKNSEQDLFLPSDLDSELSYNIFLIDEIIKNLKEVSNEAAETGEKIINSTQNLSIAARETAQTSISEASAIRECLATMETAKQQHESIANIIMKIQDSAEITKFNADLGGELLGQGIRKMEEIAVANLDTIYGIKDLSEKVENIWNIIDTIDSIAERTRTIAFNAELEASAAEGTGGEKFHIVANEIRRLANTISNSTREVKKKLNNIQHSSDNLIISSEAGTQKTREGSRFYSDLEEHFKELCVSSDITAESVKRISEISGIQKDAFAQINDTLREINSGFEHFSNTSQRISRESEELRQSAINMGFSEKITEAE